MESRYVIGYPASPEFFSPLLSPFSHSRCGAVLLLVPGKEFAKLGPTVSRFADGFIACKADALELVAPGSSFISSVCNYLHPISHSVNPSPHTDESILGPQILHL